MLDSVLAALSSFLHPSTFIMLTIGVVAGLAMGVLPGIGGTAAVAILLPFVITLEPQQSLPLLIGAVAVVHHSDVITAILLRVPGSASAAVIMPDGNAMARQGQAARAFALCFVASMIGGLLGAVGLTFSIPIAQPLVLAFGSPELFMLTVLGISLAALLSHGNMLKGLVAGALGLLVGMIGAAPAAAVYRFSFGSDALLDGIGLIPLALGFFGLAEIAHIVAKKSAIAERLDVGGGWRRGARESVQHWKLTIRGALVGMWAGVLPGLGATAGTYMAYGQAVATTKKRDRKKFGSGDPRGLVSAESAVNSVEAGDLIPTLLFGIPGGAPAALLMGALLAYGIQPGPQMITDHLDVMYTIVWSFAFASVIGSLLCFFLARPLARLSYVPFQRLAPGLLLIMFVASFQSSGQFGALVAMLILGAFGYVMKESNFPRAPFLIGFILSLPMERYYFLTSNLFTTAEWVRRPYVIVMIGILVLPLVLALVRRLRARLASSEEETPADARRSDKSPQESRETAETQLVSTTGGHAATQAPRDETHSPHNDRATPPAGTDTPATDGDDDSNDEEKAGLTDSLWPLAFSVLTLAMFVVALVLGQEYPPRARLMPTLVASIGAVLTALLVTREAIAAYRRRRGAPSWSPEVNQTAIAFGWLLLLIVLVNFLGFIVGALIFVPIFLWRVARLKALGLTAYTAVTIGVLIVAYTLGNIDMPAGTMLPVLPLI